MTILFPATNRVHVARQKLLIRRLEQYFTVIVSEFHSNMLDRLNAVAEYANFYRTQLSAHRPDLVLIRGDRYEMLPVAMLASYSSIPIAHLEGGDLTGVIDNKVRHAITHLADIHFATNKESYKRLIHLGTDPDLTFDFGSLDVEFAAQVEVVKPKQNIVVAFHPIPGENPAEITRALSSFSDVNVVKSNKDYGSIFGKEEYSPEKYIKLIGGAACLVGNSSSFLKEASFFGTPVVNVGLRQQNRLRPRNVMDVPCDARAIKIAVNAQLEHGRHEPDLTYYKEGTSLNIAEALWWYMASYLPEKAPKEF